MATDKKITTVRLSDRHRGILDLLVAESGLSISAVIEQLLECTNTHQGDITLLKPLDGSGLNLKISDSTKPKSDITLKGMAADKAIARGKTKFLANSYWERKAAKKQLLWLDGWLWLVGKSANGCQKVIEKLIEYPEVVFDGAGDTLFTLEQYTEAKANWNELKALDGIELTGDRFFKNGRSFFSGDQVYDGFRHHKERAIEAIAEYRASLQETTSALNLVQDEIAIEAITEAPSPLKDEPINAIESSSVEAQTLAKDEFKDMFSLSDDEYSLAATVGKDQGWLDPNGDRWFISGGRRTRLWTRAAKVLSL